MILCVGGRSGGKTENLRRHGLGAVPNDVGRTPPARPLLESASFARDGKALPSDIAAHQSVQPQVQAGSRTQHVSILSVSSSTRGSLSHVFPRCTLFTWRVVDFGFYCGTRTSVIGFQKNDFDQ
ncbi:hypothetical protein EVAR_48254_1 [Eumeta japonica]|uniref:Uncharacterized protein n=1 Tax=Eumeta variegata TaxID=151549 RepID=A0A4C1YGT7_EUMVA|nr:hypothetical protein EVAR_48254_1 [Eumeta japonica]